MRGSVSIRHILHIILLIGTFLPPITTARDSEADPHAKLDRPLRAMLRATHDTESVPHAIQYAHPDEEFLNILVYGERSKLETLTVDILSGFDWFVTARASPDEIRSLAGNGSVKKISVGSEFELLMDRSRSELRTDMLQRGLLGNTTFTGRGVIVGIIDTGIDMFHHDFRIGPQLERSRILSIWDMGISAFPGETSPSPYGYGVAYSRSDIEHDINQENPFLRIVRSTDRNGHGTHIAGIIGGNGTRSDGMFTGNAPDVEFIIVRLPQFTVREPHIIDAIGYVFSEADRLGKSAVVNLGLGSHQGAHDGTSALETVIDLYNAQPGRVVVVASGNSGDRGVHAGGIVPPDNSASLWLVTKPEEEAIAGNEFIRTQLWYESDDTASVTVQTPGGIRYTVTTGESGIAETDDGIVDIETFGGEMNGKGARLFDVIIRGYPDTGRFTHGEWSIQIRSNDAPLVYNMWLISASDADVSLTPNTGRAHTVTIPATAESAVGVGSYAIRNSWESFIGTINTNTELYTLSPFSSGGPTRDGRRKPEVTAPGEVIISTISDNARTRFFTRYIHDWYETMQGSSIAAAQVAGVAAVLFEYKPELTGLEVRDLLMRSARKDAFTREIPNNEWGSGKVDAYALLGLAGRFTDRPYSNALVVNYPNPFNTSTIIQFSLATESHVTLRVYDILGRPVGTLVEETLPSNLHAVRFDAGGLSSGVYFYRIETDTYTETKRMILVR
jgi:minor extracellular serine protease Vpr